MRIERLYRYPVKGLSAEALGRVTLEPGRCLPWDRAFALAQGDAPFDPAAPRHLPKSNFMCMLRNARIVLLRAGYDPHDGLLSLRAPDGSGVVASPLTPEGREQLGAFLTAFLGEEARGTPQLHYVPGHAFSDHKNPVVSLINRATLADFEARVGAPRELIRFRANVYFSGAPARSEEEWTGRILQVGSATLEVTARIDRCNATQVNPATGERDADPVRELRRHYGHVDLGVYARVVEGGSIAVGDTITLLPEFPKDA